MLDGNEHRDSPAGAGERVPGDSNETPPLDDEVRTEQEQDSIARQTLGNGLQFLDDAVRSASGGMGIADVRAVFRGDPPVDKFDPRYLVSIQSFLAHLRPRDYAKSATKFTHTFGLGYLCVFSLVVEIITGLFLMIWYIPAQDQAYQSTVRILTRVPFGQMMLDIHRIGAELMVIAAVLHMFRVYLTGSFKHPRRFTWVTGVILLVLTLALSLSGYLLPWDQSGYWAVTLSTAMIRLVPPQEIFGQAAKLLLWGGDAIGQSGLSRFYQGHVILLPCLAVTILAVHYYRVSRLHGISLPASEEESPDPAVRMAAKERIDYLPEIFAKELMWLAIGVFAIVAFAAFAFHAPLEHHSDPFRTPLHTTAPWYFLWVQGMLRDPVMLPILRGLRDTLRIDLVQFYDSSAVQGVIFPTLFFVLLFAVPYLDEWWDRRWGRQSSRLGHNRRLGIGLGLSAAIMLVLFSYLGTPLYGVSAPPAVEIAQEFMPEECVLSPVPLIPEDCGEVRRLGYEALQVGTYELAQYASAPVGADAFARLLTEMQLAVAGQVARAQGGDTAALSDAKGFFVVADWQTDLKQVTMRITWTPRGAGDAGTYEKTIYLHKDSAYE